MKLTKRNLVIALIVLILMGSTILSALDMFGGGEPPEETPVIAVIETNKGVIEIELDEEASPYLSQGHVWLHDTRRRIHARRYPERYPRPNTTGV